VARLLSAGSYLGITPEIIAASLRGGAAGEMLQGRSVFFRGAATFPWRSHAQWFIGQMKRWGYLGAVDAVAVAEALYRPDLYALAAADLGLQVPTAATKSEGEHGGGWRLPAAPEAIEMGPDRFCDGAVFRPEALTPVG
jgi:NitT/TauT family transport system ATP-binding protein/nitrate/nitrite transport system substrate-binding protein